MADPPLVELIYLSAAVRPLAPSALRDVLSVSRRNNRGVGITGILIHVDGSFLQVLEGEPAKVAATFARIEKDPRHHKVLRLFNTPKTERSFGEWTMGFVEPTPEVRAMPGFNEFFTNGLAKADFRGKEADKVRALTDQFRLGRWRQAVTST